MSTQDPRIGVIGADGALGRLVLRAVAGRGATPVAIARGVPVPDDLVAVAVAAPWHAVDGVPASVAAVGATLAPRAEAPSSPAAARIPVCGWFGGLGTLLAARAAGAAGPVREVHVAYAVLPGLVRAWSSLTPGLRTGAVELLTGSPGVARVEGAEVPEAVAEGRRLAWFPRPVGPWHAVAVPGAEAAALDAPTVRTWVGFGSLGAELLQALAHGGPDGPVGRRLASRAQRGGRGQAPDLRWAVVAEVLASDGTVHRGWANGTDPARVAGELVAASAVRAGGLPGARTVLDLAPSGDQLDDLADRGVLRWSVARPDVAAG